MQLLTPSLSCQCVMYSTCVCGMSSELSPRLIPYKGQRSNPMWPDTNVHAKRLIAAQQTNAIRAILTRDDGEDQVGKAEVCMHNVNDEPNDRHCNAQHNTTITQTGAEAYVEQSHVSNVPDADESNSQSDSVVPYRTSSVLSRSTDL